MAKSNNNLLLAVSLVAAIIISWLVIDNITKSMEINDMKKRIAESENLNEEIKKRLRELIQNNKEINPEISRELSQIAALLEIKQDNTAVLKLTKIIEHLLRELYEGNVELKELAKANGRKNPVLADYLEFAKNKGIITAEDFHLLSVMKIIRNEEAHEIDVQKEKSRILAAFICGVGLILTLCRLLKKDTLKETVKENK